MKVMVVGGAGYVGDFLVNTLITKGYKVIVVDNLMYSDRYLKEVRFINADVTDTFMMKAIVEGNKPDYVIWAAALVGDPICSSMPDKAFHINTKAVLDFMDIYDGPMFYFSTCSVYGANNEILDEESPVNPLSVYASTKLEAEKALLARGNVLVYRLGTLLGMSGIDARPRFDLVGNALTLKAMNNSPITVFGGEQMRPLMSVKEVAHAVAFGMQNKLTGLYNIAEVNMNISDLAILIKDITRSSSPIVTRDIQFEDMRNYKVDCSKLKATGWKVLYPINYAIAEFADIISSKRVKNPDHSLYYNGRYEWNLN